MKNLLTTCGLALSVFLFACGDDGTSSQTEVGNGESPEISSGSSLQGSEDISSSENQSGDAPALSPSTPDDGQFSSDSQTGDREGSSSSKAYLPCDSCEYGVLVDSRDKKEYLTVKIGEQVWMAENLNYADSVAYPILEGRSWCLDDKLDSCAKYGRYYTWSAVVDSTGEWNTVEKETVKSVHSPVTPLQGVCDKGWHVPTEAEYMTLFEYVGGISTAGKVLKSRWSWNWNKSDNVTGNGTDAYGFTALPVGSKGTIGELTYFWTSSSVTNMYKRAVRFDNLYDKAIINDVGEAQRSFVRCVKD